MTPPRALILDLDGTVIDYRQRLHPRVRDAVLEAGRRVPVIIATGRMYHSALPWARRLGVRAPLVCYQGAMVRDMPGDGEDMGALVMERPLRAGPARRALGVARENGWHFQAYLDEELLCEQDRPEAHLYSRVSGMPFRVVPDLAPLLERGTTKAACVIEDPAVVDTAIAVMSGALQGLARVTRSNPEFVEILDLEVSKAAACELVCRSLGLRLRDAAAIGDAPNDIEVLRAAGYGIAVASSRPEVIAAADAMCAAPEDAGVADALAMLGLSGA